MDLQRKRKFLIRVRIRICSCINHLFRNSQRLSAADIVEGQGSAIIQNRCAQGILIRLVQLKIFCNTVAIQILPDFNGLFCHCLIVSDARSGYGVGQYSIGTIFQIPDPVAEGIAVIVQFQFQAIFRHVGSHLAIFGIDLRVICFRTDKVESLDGHNICTVGIVDNCIQVCAFLINAVAIAFHILNVVHHMDRCMDLIPRIVEDDDIALIGNNGNGLLIGVGHITSNNLEVLRNNSLLIVRIRYRTGQWSIRTLFQILDCIGNGIITLVQEGENHAALVRSLEVDGVAGYIGEIALLISCVKIRVALGIEGTGITGQGGTCGRIRHGGSFVSIQFSVAVCIQNIADLVGTQHVGAPLGIQVKIPGNGHVGRVKCGFLTLVIQVEPANKVIACIGMDILIAFGHTRSLRYGDLAAVGHRIQRSILCGVGIIGITCAVVLCGIQLRHLLRQGLAFVHTGLIQEEADRAVYRGPLGVEDDILCGHCSVIKIKRVSLKVWIVIPSGKTVRTGFIDRYTIFIHRIGRDIRGKRCKRTFKFYLLRLFNTGFIEELQLILCTVIVEIDIIGALVKIRIVGLHLLGVISPVNCFSIAAFYKIIC